MSQDRHALGLIGRFSLNGLVAFIRVLSDGGGDGVVKRPIEQTKVIRADGLVQFDGISVTAWHTSP